MASLNLSRAALTSPDSAAETPCSSRSRTCSSSSGAKASPAAARRGALGWGSSRTPRGSTPDPTLHPHPGSSLGRGPAADSSEGPRPRRLTFLLGVLLLLLLLVQPRDIPKRGAGVKDGPQDGPVVGCGHGAPCAESPAAGPQRAGGRPPAG